MSRYYDDYVEHSWGTDPKQKVKEKAYNAAYYAQHKAEILARQAKRNAKKAGKAIGEGASAAGRAIGEGASAAGRIANKAGRRIVGNDAKKQYKKANAKYKENKELAKYYKTAWGDTWGFEDDPYMGDSIKASKQGYKIATKESKKYKKKADKAKFEYDTSLVGVRDHAGKAIKKAGKTLKKAKKNLSKSLNPEPTVTLGDPVVTGTNGVPTKKSKTKAPKKVVKKSKSSKHDSVTVTLGEPVVTGTNGVPTKKSKSKACKKKKK